eukprot:4999155-Pyramimonas_sp.AAC.1
MRAMSRRRLAFCKIFKRLERTTAAAKRSRLVARPNLRPDPKSTPKFLSVRERCPPRHSRLASKDVL